MSQINYNQEFMKLSSGYSDSLQDWCTTYDEPPPPAVAVAIVTNDAIIIISCCSPSLGDYSACGAQVNTHENVNSGGPGLLHLAVA